MWLSLTSLQLFIVINIQGLHSQNLEVPSESPQTVYKSRCTRRFTPGVCEEPAAPVWTFSFPLQNCTERLGCPISYRTNRFASYRKCMRRCRPLIDIYLQILAIDNNSSIYFLRNQPDKAGRREGEVNLLDLNETQLDLEDDGTDKDEESSTTEEPLFNLYYRDDSEAEFSLLPDIDYMAGRQETAIPDYVYD